MKILIVTKNWLGDLLFQIPAIEAIRAKWPDSEIACLAPLRCCEILSRHPAVNRVFVFDERDQQRSLRSRLAVVRRLRQERWDQAYLFHRSRTRAFLVALAGAKQRIGYGCGRRWLLTRPVLEPVGRLHQVDYFLHLVREAGLPESGTSARYRFYFSSEDQILAGKIMAQHALVPGRYVCFHLGANWEPKRWPVSHFAGLAEALDKQRKYSVVMTGGPGDAPLAEEMMGLTKNARLVNLTGQTSLGVLGAFFRQSAFVVSADSGPMHIAAGVGARVVALFGPTDPVLTGPRGIGDSLVLHYVPSGYQVPWFGGRGQDFPADGWLSKLSPDEVMRKIELRWGHDFLEPARGSETVDPRPVQRFEDPPVKNILIVSLSNIGDVILTTPVMSAVANRYPGALITAVVGPKAKGLFARTRILDRIIIYDKKAGLPEKWKFLRELRRVRYDWVIDLRNTAIPFLVRTRRRSPLFRRHRHLSMRARHLEVLAMSGLEQLPAPAAFDFFDSRDLSSIRVKIKNLGLDSQGDWILISAGAGSEVKRWPVEKFGSLIRLLLGVAETPILLVGDASEREMSARLVLANPARIHNLCGQTTLAELTALISRCRLLVANDSAIMHLGHELDRPVVALFGPTHQEKYGRTGEHFRVMTHGVPCRPCEAAQCRLEKRVCLEDLDSSRVFEVCRVLLKETSPCSSPLVEAP